MADHRMSKSVEKLSEKVQDKVSEVASDLVEEESEEGDAIISKAARWADDKLDIDVLEDETTPRHVVPHGEGWAIKAENVDVPNDVFDSRAEAIDRAHQIGRRQETVIMIHGSDGQIEEHRNFMH